MGYNYNIHGLVRIKSDIKLPLPRYFENDKNIHADVEFFEEDLDFERPEECETMRIGSYYWLSEGEDEGEGKLRFEHPGGAKLELDLNNAKITFNSRFVKFSSKPTLEFLIARILQTRLIDKGYAMIHAGCVAFDDAGALIIAPPDFGKTSTVLSLVAFGADFLGDDHVIVNKDGTALCYPKRLTISPHTITSGVVKSVGFWRRILAKLGPLYAITLRLLGSQAEDREVPEEIIRDCVTIDYALALKGFAPSPRLEPVNEENLIEPAILPMPYMTGFPDSYIDLYLYLRDVGLQPFLKGGMEILRKALEDVKCYGVKGPSIKSWPQMIREEIG